MMSSLLEGLNFGKKSDHNSDPVSKKASDDERRNVGDRREGERRQNHQKMSVERRLLSDRRGEERRLRIRKNSTMVVIAPSKEDVDDRINLYGHDEERSLPESLIPYADEVYDQVLEVVSLPELAKLTEDDRRAFLTETIIDIIDATEVPAHGIYQQRMVDRLIDDILGFGPLEPLLKDPSITDIMVNGPEKIWVEKDGNLCLTNITFANTRHLMNVIQRIVWLANRHIDESSPMVDARLPDGSRINVIIPPLAIRHPTMSIRKFSAHGISLDEMVTLGSMSEDMAGLLKIIAKYRLNTLICGGTGTGKTTLMSAIADHISANERVVSIEDTVELKLNQPNLVELEVRPMNIEGIGEISIHDLLKNALRMRPDRIIVGEVRGSEAAEMLQAMNTGHDGSMGTLHANNPLDAISRFENMICMGGKHEPGRITLQQIVNTLDIVVHITRMHDGSRRVVNIAEVVDLVDGHTVLRNLYTFEFMEERPDGTIIGSFEPSLVRPHFLERLKFYSLTAEEKELLAKFVDPPDDEVSAIGGT